MIHDHEESRQETQPDGSEVLQFGPFALDRARAMLVREGVEVPLRPKCFDVLRHLVENPGRLVTKEELLGAAWPGLVVTDSSLPQCMVEIRKALGAEAGEMIATVPRRGYRFEAPVHHVSLGKRTTAAAVMKLPHRFAPFLAAGAAALLLTAGLLGFSSHTGERTGSLPEAAGPLKDTVEKRESGDSIAQEQYLQGRYFQNRRAVGDLRRSIDYFREAVALDPGLAAAWVGLAGSIWLDAKERGDSDFATWGAEFRVTLERALEIDPASAEAHARMANYYLSSGDLERADEHFAIALRNGSDSPLIFAMAAGVAFWQHDPARAAELAGHAVELEPLSFVQQANYGNYLLYAGNPALARKHLEIAQDLNSSRPELAADQLMQALVLLGDFAEVRRLTERMPDNPFRDQGLALAHNADGDLSARDQYIHRLESRDTAESALRLAEVYGYLAQADSARWWFEVALQRNMQESSLPACQDEFILEATLSPFLVNVLVEPAASKPTAREVAQQFSGPDDCSSS